MKRFQGLLGTALTYSIARRFLDHDPEMRQIMGWFVVSFSVALVMTFVIGRVKAVRGGK